MDTQIPMERYGVSLPEHYHRKLLAWAKFKGTDRARLSSNIIQARIEVNWPDLEREIRELIDAPAEMTTQDVIEAFIQWGESQD